jgi:hypothetical protein
MSPYLFEIRVPPLGEERVREERVREESVREESVREERVREERVREERVREEEVELCIYMVLLLGLILTTRG